MKVFSVFTALLFAIPNLQASPQATAPAASSSSQAATSSFVWLRASRYARRRNPLTECDCRMIHPADPGGRSPLQVDFELVLRRPIETARLIGS
jgi:hypothetical protein